MKTHTRVGASILGGTDIPLLNMARRIALCHHEKWNGGGYSQGLSGHDIPIEARIVSIVDVYDALTHARVYKPAWPEEEAIEYLMAQRGNHFDPELLDLFLANLRAMREIRLANPD
jgi:putative two-component system response regulator